MSRSPLPAALDGAAASRPARLAAPLALDDGFVTELGGVCAGVTVSDQARVEAARDWWPLSTVWALGGQAPALQPVLPPARKTGGGTVVRFRRTSDPSI